MSGPRFTVLMPTHYRPDVIGFAIHSVLAQTEPDFELLIVGDGVGDETRGAVAQFTDPRIRFFDLPKAPGFGYANRNTVLGQSRGELIAFCADDDVLFPDHLERLGAALADAETQWACTPCFWVSKDGIAAPDLTNLRHEDERRYLLEVGNTLSGGCVAYRASAFPTRQAIPEHLPMAADWHMFKDLLVRYGPSGLAVIDVPGFLHFTAGRKSERNSQFPLLSGYLDVADNVDWWPGILRQQPLDGSLQAAYARVLAEPDGAERLRKAGREVVTRVALDRLAPRIEPGARESRAWQRAPAISLAPAWRPIRAALRRLLRRA